MIEVEKKFYVDDKTIAKLKKLGKVVSEKRVLDHYWDKNDFSVTKSDCWLRKRNGKWQMKIGVQKQANVKRITVYEELDDEKDIAEYLSLDLQVGTEFEELLKKQKYNCFMTIDKARLRLEIDEFTIDIDDFDDGQDILEIELVVDSQDQVQEAVDKIFKFVKDIGIDPKPKRFGRVVDYIQKEYPELFNELMRKGVVQE